MKSTRWRKMTTAPKDQVILVTEQQQSSEGYVLPAIWGRPKGFADKDAGWWGVTFAMSPEAMFDFPELHARLVALVPKAWKPYPKV